MTRDLSRSTSQYCHPKLETLVAHGKLSASDARAITFESFNASALSNIHIFHLVLDERISVEQAFAISIKEVENPIEYLNNRSTITPTQNRRLEIYTENPDISPYDAELILILENKVYCTVSERKELALLRDPATRAYAQQILILETNPERSPKDERKLELLYLPHARAYAAHIAELEFKENKTTKVCEQLELLYLKVCCKIAEYSPGIVAYRRFQADRLSNSRECDFQTASPSVNFFQQNNVSFAKETVERAIKKDIIEFYLIKHKVKKEYWNSVEMLEYLDKKLALFRHAILKYFVDYRAPEFNLVNLEIVIKAIQAKIQSQELTLNNENKLSNLHTLLNSSIEHTLNHNTPDM